MLSFIEYVLCASQSSMASVHIFYFKSHHLGARIFHCSLHFPFLWRGKKIWVITLEYSGAYSCLCDLFSWCLGDCTGDSIWVVCMYTKWLNPCSISPANFLCIFQHVQENTRTMTQSCSPSLSRAYLARSHVSWKWHPSNIPDSWELLGGSSNKHKDLNLLICINE